MALKFFVVPVMDAASSEADANGFLGCHKVISVDRHFVEQGNNSFWSLCVEYIPGGPAEPSRHFDRSFLFLSIGCILATTHDESFGFSPPSPPQEEKGPGDEEVGARYEVASPRRFRQTPTPSLHAR